jgi:predicted nucleotidyltransferase
MPGRPNEATSLRERLREHRPELLAAAARRGASNLRIFGSVARGDDNHDAPAR